MNEPQWLQWSRQLQAIAQTGLAFTVNPYDMERYEALRKLAAEIMAAHTASTAESIEALFRAESGYPTPKIDVRAAVFDGEGRILMVREASDGHRWTLPGGWADVNLSTAESAVKEVRQESGYEARILRPAAMWDRARQGHPPSLHSCLKLFYLCELAVVRRAPASKPARWPGSRAMMFPPTCRWVARCRDRSRGCSNTTPMRICRWTTNSLDVRGSCAA